MSQQVYEFVNGIRAKYGDCGIINFFLDCDYGERTEYLRKKMNEDSPDYDEDVRGEFIAEGIENFMGGDAVRMYTRDDNDNWEVVTLESPTYEGVKFEFVETEGGGEGGSEDVRTVLKMTFPDGEIGFMQIRYNYYSYEGFTFDWSWFRAAEPEERVVIFYNDIA